MADVVLLYAIGCPNVIAARSNLMRAFSQAGIGASWREIDVDDAATSEEWRRFGSPTVLVDGEDVAGGTRFDGPSCRVYDDDGRLAGAPGVETIAMKLTLARSVPEDPLSADADNGKRARPVGALVAGLPGVVLALLPKGLCPACWPAYAAVLSALGLGFLMQDRYLLPLTLGFLALTTAVLSFRARQRHGFTPAIVAFLAGGLFLSSKFVFEVPALSYVGLGAFMLAVIWNAWPARKTACPACPPAGSVMSSS